MKLNLQRGFFAGAMDFLLNFPPGLIAGLLLGWKPLAAVLLGGVTYISSSGVIAKVLAELQRLGCPETPAVLAILVLEDHAMAVYLPLVAALLVKSTRETIRAGMALVARGEFSIVIAGLGATLEPQIEPPSAAYVLLLAILGPILARAVN